VFEVEERFDLGFEVPVQSLNTALLHPMSFLGYPFLSEKKSQ